MTPEEKLRAHNSEFEKTVFKLTDTAYLAVGYAASNVGMIIGEDGLIIIDTTESTKAAENILAEFRKITDLPVKTIIYTHSHRDHISGATVFAAGRLRQNRTGHCSYYTGRASIRHGAGNGYGAYQYWPWPC